MFALIITAVCIYSSCTPTSVTQIYTSNDKCIRAGIKHTHELIKVYGDDRGQVRITYTCSEQ